MSLPPPLTIAALASQAASSDLEGFTEALGMGALIGSLPIGTGEWAYHTDLRRKFSPLMPGVELAGSVVFPLRKTQATFKDTILIGRSLSNDICIPHPSISKLHARIRKVDAQVVISDAGSSNGIDVDQVPITEEVTLTSGVSVDMGDCSFIFYEPRALYEALLELRQGSFF